MFKTILIFVCIMVGFYLFCSINNPNNSVNINSTGWLNTKWEMSPAEVIQAVPNSKQMSGPPWNDNTPVRWIFNSNLKVAIMNFDLMGHSCMVDFDFGETNSLQEVNVFPRKATTSYVINVINTLIEKYGNPTIDNTRIFNDGSGKEIKLIWSNPNTNIMLYALVGSEPDQKGNLEIHYHSGTQFNKNL